MLVDDDVFITKSEQRISALTNDLKLSTYYINLIITYLLVFWYIISLDLSILVL